MPGVFWRRGSDSDSCYRSHTKEPSRFSSPFVSSPRARKAHHTSWDVSIVWNFTPLVRISTSELNQETCDEKCGSSWELKQKTPKRDASPPHPRFWWRCLGGPRLHHRPSHCNCVMLVRKKPTRPKKNPRPQKKNPNRPKKNILTKKKLAWPKKSSAPKKKLSPKK